MINTEECQGLVTKKNTIFSLATTVNTVTKYSIDLMGGVFLTFKADDLKTKSELYGWPLSLMNEFGTPCVANDFSRTQALKP